MQKPLRTLIIEDEQDSIDLMLNLITNYCPELSSCGIAQNVAEGIDKIKSLIPDVVLMDVSLGTEKSFEILDQLKNRDFILVFTTAYADYAVKAFEHDAVHYMLKPYSISGMRKTIEKIMDARRLLLIKGGHSSKYAITSLGETIFVDIDHIVYVEASRSYSKIYMQNNASHIISKPLSQVEKDLGLYNFFRIHHSYIINFLHVKKILRDKEYMVIMSNDKELPISRSKKEDLFNNL